MSDQTPARALQDGARLANRYTLTRRLGRGGAAETWLASDRITRKPVAIKVALPGVDAASLRNEWQTAIRLMHAHIVRVFEFHDDEPPFYSLQFIDGNDIGALCGAAPADSLPPVALVADALRYAHGKGVVHRDIKASNILLDRNGAPYVIDFGVASRRGVRATGGSLIAASPQQLAGEAAQPADDIFALGGLIFELVSGRPPWGPDVTADDIRERVPPRLVAADGSAVPDALAELVARMLAKDAAERPDAETVASELAAMGYAPAPAPARYVTPARGAADELIESRESLRAIHREALRTTDRGPAQAAPGISPRLLAAAFGVLLLLLVGVVFLLPGTVTREPGVSEETETAGPSETGAYVREQQSDVPFNENIEDLSGRDERVQARAATDEVLGELLSKLDVLQSRAVQRWGGMRFTKAETLYAEGDEAYLARDYATATARYREALAVVEPLLDEVDKVFSATYDEAQAAIEAGDTAEALRLFDLAVAISPGHRGAQEGLARAQNLDTVKSLTDQALAHERDLELEPARQAFQRAVELDPQWDPAVSGLARVNETIRQMQFDQRMSEGLEALAAGDYLGARAAFRMAQSLKPESREPADGLMQVDQGLRLDDIAALEREAAQKEQGEDWQGAAETYAAILELDANLAFAQEGLRRSRDMAGLHEQLEGYIAEPDALSRPATMQAATRLLLDITRMDTIGPRLGDQRDELSRLLKRAATPLTVRLVSDNATDVSIYKVGKLGSFETQELRLRPGTYVAVGVRPGFRDVRLEFRVAPEIDMQPIVVRCEERI